MIDDWHAADAKDDRPAMERSVEMSCVLFWQQRLTVAISCLEGMLFMSHDNLRNS